MQAVEDVLNDMEINDNEEDFIPQSMLQEFSAMKKTLLLKTGYSIVWKF